MTEEQLKQVEKLVARLASMLNYEAAAAIRDLVADVRRLKEYEFTYKVRKVGQDAETA